MALEDKLHQPYRAHLIPGLPDVFAAAKEAGAYNAIISGAGSTVMAYASPEADCERIAKPWLMCLRPIMNTPATIFWTWIQTV